MALTGSSERYWKDARRAHEAVTLGRSGFYFCPPDQHFRGSAVEPAGTRGHPSMAVYLYPCGRGRCAPPLSCRQGEVLNGQTAYEQGNAVVSSDLNGAAMAVYLSRTLSTRNTARHLTNQAMTIVGESEAAVWLTGSFNLTAIAQRPHAENLWLVSGKPT
jgi:hypothetical protein